MQALTDFLLPLFLALGSLWFAVDLVKKLRAPAPRPEPTSAPAPAPSDSHPSLPRSPAPSAQPAPSLPHSPTPLLPPSLPAEHLAVVAATIHHLYRGRARIAAVMAVATGTHTTVDWAREGRRDIFSSHRLR